MKTYTLEELRLAQAKKCRIEILVDGVWMELKNPECKEPDDVCRIHPADEWKARLPRLKEGAEWHRNDFTNEMLPEGSRPVILGESSDSEIFDMEAYFGDGAWIQASWNRSDGVPAHANHHRTRRPVPPEFLHPDELAKQSEAAQAPDFGEPWKLVGEYIFNKHSNFVGDKSRIIACVNALAGIPDPAEFVRQAMEMKEAIGLAYKALIALNHEGGCYCDAQYAMHGAHPRHSEECDMANAALAKLKPFLP